MSNLFDGVFAPGIALWSNRRNHFLQEQLPFRILQVSKSGGRRQMELDPCLVHRDRQSLVGTFGAFREMRNVLRIVRIEHKHGNGP